MPALRFYVTCTKVPLEKLSTVVSGYTIVENCRNHKLLNTKQNPNLQVVQELVIKSKLFPAALLRPTGYIANQESDVGKYPPRTIFFYKNHCLEFQKIRVAFDAAPEGTEFLWNCGCRIRKYTKQELIDICRHPWYPWAGEREIALYQYGVEWQQQRPTDTAAEIAKALYLEGAIGDDQIKNVVMAINRNRF